MLDVTKPLGLTDGRKARYVGVGIEGWPIVVAYAKTVAGGGGWAIEQYSSDGRARSCPQGLPRMATLINVVDEMEQEDWS